MGKWLDRLKEHEAESQVLADMQSASLWVKLLREKDISLESKDGNLILRGSRRYFDDQTFDNQVRQEITRLKPAILAILAIEVARSK